MQNSLNLSSLTDRVKHKIEKFAIERDRPDMRLREFNMEWGLGLIE